MRAFPWCVGLSKHRTNLLLFFSIPLIWAWHLQIDQMEQLITPYREWAKDLMPNYTFDGASTLFVLTTAAFIHLYLRFRAIHLDFIERTE